jgi:hypothetical protein
MFKKPDSGWRKDDMMSSTKKTPAWLVERAAQGELDASEIAELRARLAAEGRSLDDELETLRESNRQILTRLPRETMGAAIRRRASDAKTGQRSRLNMVLPPLAAAGALGLVILVARGVGDHGIVRSLPEQPMEETTFKGEEMTSPRLLVYRQRPGQSSAPESELLADGARGARADLLQLAYDKAPAGRYGVLISLDGAGKVTLHLPEEGASQSPPLIAVREFRLFSAYELDDAPGFERFMLVTAAQPFATKAVIEAAHALAHRGVAARTQPLPLGATFSQISVLVNKKEGTP